MAENQAKKKTGTRPARGGRGKASDGFTAEERAAMKERAGEGRRGRAAKTDSEQDVLAKIAEMPDSDRALAERVHAIVRETAPALTPRTWYGMPAYANGDKVICFFQSGQKFKTRYATLGFSERAHLDDGQMWPVAYALAALGPDVEKRIRALVKQAVS